MYYQKFTSLIFVFLAIILCNSCFQEKAGSIPKWGVFESELSTLNIYDDPFRDVNLMVTVTRPDGSLIDISGFFDGNQKWKFRVMPDMEGLWKYSGRLSDSSSYISGDFECVSSTKSGPLTICKENPIWPVRNDSPPLQIRSFHVGDRFFAGNFSDKERERFLDWLSSSGYNMISVASHYLNRNQEERGIGWDTPGLWPLNPSEFQRMEAMLSDLEKRDIMVYPFAGFFGRAAEWPTNHGEQELYIKYTLSRLASFRNIILNVAGPEPILKPEDYKNGNMTSEDINRLAILIKKFDPYNHMLSVHNRTKNENNEYEYDPFIFEAWEDFATLQGGKSGNLEDVYGFIKGSRKVIKPVYAQEVLWNGNMYHAKLNTESLRKKAITLIMAGSFINFGDMNGNSSSGFSGCLNPDSANTDAHKVIHQVWDLFDSLPFTKLAPRADLVAGALCLSDGQGNYLVYSMDGNPFTINFEFSSPGKWINPRDLKDERVASPVQGKIVSPPDNNDWFLWIEMLK